MDLKNDTAKSPRAANDDGPPGAAATTVLLVDDEESVRKLVTRFLSLHGYRVLAAADASSALTLWKAHRDEIQLLLTDVVMPQGLNGRELGQQLQLQKPELAVIYTSGYNSEWAGESHAPGDETHFVQKPYRPQQLLAAIHAALSARTPD